MSDCRERQIRRVPEIDDFEAKRQRAEVLVSATAERLLDGVHDGRRAPVQPWHPGRDIPRPRPVRALFSDSAARAVVAMRASAELRVCELCEATVVPYTIGTTGGDALRVRNVFDVRLDELRAVHEATFPVAFER